MHKRKILGIFLLLTAAMLAFLPVAGGFQMAGFHAGLLLFTGLAGIALTIS